MLDRMSSRQKAAGTIAVLGFDNTSIKPLDELVSSVFANPLIGAVTGLDFRTVEEALEQYYSSGATINAAIFAGVRRQLTNEKFRGAISSAIVRAIETMAPDTQQGIVMGLDKLAEMNVPQFKQDFQSVEHFIREGLLVFLADDSVPEGVWVTCPHCHTAFENT